MTIQNAKTLERGGRSFALLRMKGRIPSRLEYGTCIFRAEKGF